MHERRLNRRWLPGRWIVLGGLACVWLLVGCQSIATDPVDPRRYREVEPLVEAPGPPCAAVAWGPYRNLRTLCIEPVYDAVVQPQAVPDLNGLAFGPDGALYLARTARGEIWVLRDADGDQFPEALVQVAAGFTRPARLAWHDGALWVLDEGGVTRLALADDAVRTREARVSGWPDGLLPGALGFGPEGRLYVGLGVPCFTCVGDPLPRGIVLSFDADGGDQRTEATGLRFPAGLAWHPVSGALWISDGGRFIVADAAADVRLPPDEINRMAVDAARPVDFGFPFCTGSGVPDTAFTLPQAGYCSDTHGPTVRLSPQSQPASLLFYPANMPAGFTDWEADLLVALRGSTGLPEPAGYALVHIPVDPDESTGRVELVIPSAPSPDRLHEATTHYSLSEFSLAGFGFFPLHPADVAVSPEGWVYVSLEEGRIFRVRPRPKAQARD